uniref:ATP synthase F0 subunit 8 n=1 Tax=Eurycantha calcarata TaxID=93610 RepID=A0A8E5NMJ9_9NEOP|nr:ATP synthase F0 subunit 8 [Eurycantha calcarata]QVD43187.1 ATP synthase F0 subunit 8 [Eurycantha calcarata]
MPQMAPMSWMLLYMFFISMTTMFMMKIYFNKASFDKKSNNNLMKFKENNWKW